MDAVRCFIGKKQNQWDIHLPQLAGSVRSSVNRHTGYTPKKLMANLVFPSPKMAPGEGTDKYVQDLVQNIVHARPIFYFLLFQFLTDSVMDINELYQYITTFNLINITIKNTAINT